MAGLIDKQTELARLDKELSKLEKDIAQSEGKLKNPAFVDKAPPEIIAKENERLMQAKQAKEKLEKQRLVIEAL